MISPPGSSHNVAWFSSESFGSLGSLSESTSVGLGMFTHNTFCVVVATSQLACRMIGVL